MTAHRWSEVRGSFNARTRRADFRCDVCQALICEVDTTAEECHDGWISGNDCPFPGDPAFIEKIRALLDVPPVTPLQQLQGQIDLLKIK